MLTCRVHWKLGLRHRLDRHRLYHHRDCSCCAQIRIGNFPCSDQPQGKLTHCSHLDIPRLGIPRLGIPYLDHHLDHNFDHHPDHQPHLGHRLHLLDHRLRLHYHPTHLLYRPLHHDCPKALDEPWQAPAN